MIKKVQKDIRIGYIIYSSSDKEKGVSFGYLKEREGYGT